MNVHGILNRLDKCAASALTPSPKTRQPSLRLSKKNSNEPRGLLQKQTHTIEVDDGMTDDEQLQSQDPINSRGPLLDGETG
jgi:hypothetical protein